MRRIGKIEGDYIYALLNINVVYPYVKLVDVFASLIKYLRVLN